MSILTQDEFDPFAGSVVERVVTSSEAQREVWLADQLGTHASLSFNESGELRLRGPLDVKALEAAIGALLRRHEALRATFGPDGTEILINVASTFHLPYEDISALGPLERTRRMEQVVVEAVETPFSLRTGPLLRAKLYRLAVSEHVLVLTAHHIVCDGWSWGILVADLGELYAEQLGLAPAPDEPHAYSEYVQWELEESRSPRMVEHERYWLGKFAGASLPTLDLPTDRKRPVVREFASRRIDHLLDKGLLEKLRVVAAQHSASSFSLLFTGFAALLYRLTGQEDVVIGVPAAGQAASGLHRMIGHCVNLLPVRCAVDGVQPFEALLAQTAAEFMNAFEHQTLTYGTLLKKLPVDRDPSRLPLVSVMFNIDQAMRNKAQSFPGLVVDMHSHPRHFENFELFINGTHTDGGLRLECQYNTSLFDAKTIETWLQCYETLLRGVVDNASLPVAKLPWVSEAAIQSLQDLQPKVTPFPHHDLMHSAIARQCKDTPQRVALRIGNASLSYAAMEARANQLARTLRLRGIGRGSRVGLCLPRGLDMVVSLLATLKAGATYVPLDPGFPSARLAFYAKDAGLDLILCHSSVANVPSQWRSDAAACVLRLDTDTLWLEQTTEAIEAGPLDAQPEDAAYVIYTSGSTGQPKGVAVPHRAVVNFLMTMLQRPGLQANDRLAAVTTLSFDIAVLELLLPLTVGAEVLIVEREVATDGYQLMEFMAQHGATVMQATPGMWRMLVDARWTPPQGFKALVGGESFPADLATELLDRCSEVWNMYGPTETTVWSTAWRLERAALGEEGMSIGTPIANTTVWILNEALQLCPVGTPGEICIGGAGVALGYLDRPELTADRFVPDVYSGAISSGTLYRTGDRGRWKHNGLLQHLGRIDFQVKVRGYRIELGEIESLCRELASVSQAVVLARSDVAGDVRLVAYLVLVGDALLDQAALKAVWNAKLPDYMHPQHVVVLDALPLLPNGKIDRNSLPTPQVSQSLSAVEGRIAPRTELEHVVTSAMESVLTLQGLGITDDFFALGGHSLLASRLISRLNRDLDMNLPMRTLFEAPTAEKLSRAIDAAKRLNMPKRLPLLSQPGRTRAPLTPMQERIRFVEELHPGRVVYNTPSGHLLTGPMRVDCFEAALRDVVHYQPALRTRIREAEQVGGFIQDIQPSVDFVLPYTDLTDLPEDQRETEAVKRMQVIVDTPLNIYEAPLFRVALFKLDADKHAFLFMPHHIIFDGWSFDVFYQDIARFYSARVQGNSEVQQQTLQMTYGDYADWHVRWMQGEEFQAQLAFWKRTFSAAPVSRALTPDLPRKHSMTGLGAAEWIHIDKALTEKLRDIAKRTDATLNMVTMAIYTVMMAGLIHRPNIVIGVPVRGRLTPELEPIMGFFNNMLPVPLGVPVGTSVLSFIGAIKKVLLEVFSYQDIPFERLAREPEVAKHVQSAGLYQALFSFQDARERNRAWGELHQKTILLFQKGATEDFGLWLMEVPNGLEGGFIYNADMYTKETATHLCTRYLELLHRFANNPDIRVNELGRLGDSVSGQYLTRLGRDAPELLATTVLQERATTRSTVSLSAEAMPLAKIWARLLQIDISSIRPEDNFFDLGGSSLLAMQAMEATERELGLTIDAQRYIYEGLAQLAATQPATSGRQPKGFLGRLLGRFEKK